MKATTWYDISLNREWQSELDLSSMALIRIRAYTRVLKRDIRMEDLIGLFWPGADP